MAPLPPQPTRRGQKTQNDLLIKGLVVALIGLAVLLGPVFMPDSEWRATVAASALVGWFALVLGGALVAQHLRAQWQRRYKGTVRK